MYWIIPVIIILSLFLYQPVYTSPQIDSLAARLDSLESRLSKLQEKEQQEQLRLLREAAQKSTVTVENQQGELPQKSFSERSRALQALNPEISLTGDMLGKYLMKVPHYTQQERSGFQFRVAELALQSNLDPFSMAKVIFEFSPEEIGLAEAYITWINALPRLNIKAGKFRQQFGVINRWHAHALDQIEYPLPIALFMGEEGLNQIGISASWLMPSKLADASELVLEVTNAQNEVLFSGDEFSLPATLLHFKNYYDLNPDTYLEWGVSGLAGTNDSLGFTFDQAHRWSYMAGLDLTVSWRPLQQALYRGLVWRSEFFFVKKEMMNSDAMTALGAYSYLDYRLGRRFIAGIRGDYAQPLELDNSNRSIWKLIPYVTFWQSEFVYFRLEFAHQQGKNLEVNDNRFTLQLNWSLGPHKHEKY
ncbi:MAG: hypothetical protein JSW33_00925 [bacterium]|nr:MAG: hypothetical protein JSW33_00925 [bacterium]